MPSTAPLINPGSLSETANAVNAAHYSGRKLSATERLDTARFVASRQGLEGAYANSFAGFKTELKGIQLYTGEKITSASARHILGEECCRALRLLAVKDKAVSAALARAEAGLMKCLDGVPTKFRGNNPGLFCCGKCTVGLWRNLVAGSLDRNEERLRFGMQHLLAARDTTGDWHRFPFWYTVLALVDIGTPQARRELNYAAARLQRAAKSPPKEETHGRRRQELAKRALSTL